MAFFKYMILIFCSLLAGLQAETVRAASRLLEIDPAQLDGRNGFSIEGARQGDKLGTSVDGAGDFNGDGIRDLLLSAPYADAPESGAAGRIYVIFGHASGFPAQFELENAGGNRGLKLDGANVDDRIGQFVRSFGDINNDGLADIGVGAPFSSTFSGNIYVLLGKKEETTAPINVATLDGSNGFRVEGEDISLAGIAVGAGGDANNDGLMDIVFGTNEVGVGKVHLLFGQGETFAPLFFAGDLGASGASFAGPQGTGLGLAVDGYGDFNGDGITDLVIGLPFADGSGTESGRAAVVFGRDGAEIGEDIVSILNGENGFWIDGETSGDELGTAVRFVGDVNSDGFDDIAIASLQSEPNGFDSGRVYVIFGGDGERPDRLQLSQADSVAYVRINGENEADQLGTSIAGGEDINNDGIDDFIIGAKGAEEDRGCVYVFTGKENGYPGTIDLNSPRDNVTLKMCGETEGDELGLSVGMTGDINADGIGDIIIGAPYADSEGLVESGKAYVIFGVDGDVIFSNSFE